MNLGSNKVTWIIVISIIVVAAVTYFYYAGSATPASEDVLGVSGPDAEIIGAQVLDLLNQISSLNIDATLFADASYRTLRDYSVAIPPQNVGRTNPFAPLPGSPVTPVTPAR